MKTARTGSRRTFLRESGAMLGGTWVSFSMPMLLAVAQTACKQRDAAAPWVNISEREAEALAALADQVIPPDDTPGAAEVGVVYFIDAALGGFMQGAAAMLRAGLADLDNRAGRSSFAALDFTQQTAVLEKIENTPFFQTMLFLVQAGMFALPTHGGNRDGAGWALIGFEHRHVWQPPYGHYDADAHGQDDNDHGA